MRVVDIFSGFTEIFIHSSMLFDVNKNGFDSKITHENMHQTSKLEEGITTVIFNIAAAFS